MDNLELKLFLTTCYNDNECVGNGLTQAAMILE